HGAHLIGSLGRHSMQWIRTRRFKYLWFSGDRHEQLFDLEQDPQEEHDLDGSAAHGDELHRHRELLTGELEQRAAGRAPDLALTAQTVTQSESSSVREDVPLEGRAQALAAEDVPVRQDRRSRGCGTPR